MDDVQASFDAIKYLVSRGHRNIAMISGHLSDEVSGKSRFDGYRAALNYYGLPFDERFVAYGDYRYQHGYAAMGDLLSRKDETGILPCLPRVTKWPSVPCGGTRHGDTGS